VLAVAVEAPLPTVAAELLLASTELVVAAVPARHHESAVFPSSGFLLGANEIDGPTVLKAHLVDAAVVLLRVSEARVSDARRPVVVVVVAVAVAADRAKNQGWHSLPL